MIMKKKLFVRFIEDENRTMTLTFDNKKGNKVLYLLTFIPHVLILNCRCMSTDLSINVIT